MIELQASESVLQLPNPVLDNSESAETFVNLQQAMSGETYSYISKANKIRLIYNFRSVSRENALGLVFFFETHNNEVLRLVDHLGEPWEVEFDMTALPIVTDTKKGSGESCSFDLEFIGNKIPTQLVTLKGEDLMTFEDELIIPL